MYILIWNVIGVINGIIFDEVVVVGNYCDVWVVGGVGDLNSGLVVLNEVMCVFGEVFKCGWKFCWIVVFVSWDGEEYGLVGLMEWVEEYFFWFKYVSVVYVVC